MGGSFDRRLASGLDWQLGRGVGRLRVPVALGEAARVAGGGARGGGRLVPGLGAELGDDDGHVVDGDRLVGRLAPVHAAQSG